MKHFSPICALCAAAFFTLPSLTLAPAPARAAPMPLPTVPPFAPTQPHAPSPLRLRISALERQCAALQAQAAALDGQAAQQARAREFDRAQALYGQAAALHHRQAHLTRVQALALANAGQASLAARKHAQALAADQSFLRSTASQVALLQREAGAQPASAGLSPAPPAATARPLPPKHPAPRPRAPVRPALVTAPARPVKKPALPARRLLPAMSATRRAALLGLRASAQRTLAKAARPVPSPRRVRPRPSRTAWRPPSSLPAASPPDQPTVAELTSTVWHAAQETTVDRAFEDAAPVQRRPHATWIFRANGTWQRETPAGARAGTSEHGWFVLLAGKLVLLTQAKGGVRQTTSYQVSLDQDRRTLTLLTSTPTGFTRTRLEAQAARPLR